MSGDDLNRIIKIKFIRIEFVDVFGLKFNFIFVCNMFMMVDKNNSGFVEFQEFFDMFVVLVLGNQNIVVNIVNYKMKYIFLIYNICFWILKKVSICIR